MRGRIEVAVSVEEGGGSKERRVGGIRCLARRFWIRERACVDIV